MCSIREVHNYISIFKSTIVNLSSMTKSGSLLNNLFTLIIWTVFYEWSAFFIGSIVLSY